VEDREDDIEPRGDEPAPESVAIDPESILLLPGGDTERTASFYYTGGLVAVGDRITPAETRLLPPSPNPLSRSSALRFDLARGGRVRLEVFDINGRRVALVADRAFDPGRYRLDWNGRDDGGARLGAGLYFVRMSGPGLAPRSVRLAVVR